MVVQNKAVLSTIPGSLVSIALLSSGDATSNGHHWLSERGTNGGTSRKVGTMSSSVTPLIDTICAYGNRKRL
jgi:hypothetical protein